MIILKNESPILCLINNNFYEEVTEYSKEIEAYIKNSKNGGCGTQITDDYYWSNTHGETCDKIFRKISNGLILEPKQHNELEKINELNMNERLEYVKNLIGEDSLLKISYCSFNEYYSTINLSAIYEIKKDNLIYNYESDFAKYAELFRGRHEYYISLAFLFKAKNSDLLNMNEENYISVVELEKYLNQFNDISISITYSCIENLYYSPSQFIQIDEVYTLSEASLLWNKTEGALRNAIKTEKFIENIEWRKSGRITLITKKGMERVYGTL